MSGRRCAWCAELYGESECTECGRGLCEMCDPKTRRGAFVGPCWDCGQVESKKEWALHESGGGA